MGQVADDRGADHQVPVLACTGSLVDADEVVDQPRRDGELGTAVADLLFEEIATAAPRPRRQMEFSPELVVRASTGGR